METKKAKKTVEKKKKMIIALLSILIVIMIILGFVLGSFIYKKIKTNMEPQNGNMNTLYIEEKVERKRGGKRFDGRA